MIRFLQRHVIPLLPKGIGSVVWRVLPASWQAAYRKNSNDVYIVSYPCCGRTWLRLMIGATISNQFDLGASRLFETHNLALEKEGIPRIVFSHDGLPFRERPEDLSQDKSFFQGTKVILLVRDPRDVLVSWYYEQKKRRDVSTKTTHPFDGSLSEFLSHPYGTTETIIAYYNIWLASKAVPRDFLILRYEDLKTDTEGTLKMALAFMGLPQAEDKTLKDAVAYASFDNMKKMEADGTLGWDSFKPGDKNDPQSFKTRSGQAGGYKKELSTEDIAALNTLISETLDPTFGY